MSLLPVAEAQARLFALARPVEAETVPLLAAAGRWGSAPVLALRTQPAADLSAMDGYAIRFAERPGPWRVVGESAAGGGLDRALQPGESARIFTGAPLPAGTDTILIQEEATRNGDCLTMTGEGPPHAGTHIRSRGRDFAEGALLIEAGARLTPARIALAAAAGHAMLPVRRRIRIGILATGDELVPVGAPTPGLALPSSNTPMIAALLGDLPADIVNLGIVGDDRVALAAAFQFGARNVDLLVTTGGASVGDHDLVRPALADAGAEIDFWRIAMKPGKPLLAGTLGQTIVLGLPGNPVSAFVTAHVFLRPLVAMLSGATDPLPTVRPARLGAALPATGVRAEYLRAAPNRIGIAMLADQDSAGLSALAAASALIVRAAHAPALEIGALVDVIDIA